MQDIVRAMKHFQSHDESGNTMESVGFCLGFLNNGIQKKVLDVLDLNLELFVHVGSSLRTSKSKDFILVMMPQHGFLISGGVASCQSTIIINGLFTIKIKFLQSHHSVPHDIVFGLKITEIILPNPPEKKELRTMRPRAKN